MNTIQDIQSNFLSTYKYLEAIVKMNQKNKKSFMTVNEKVDEYLKEFSVEKSIDLAETMLDVSKNLSPQDDEFWESVINILKTKKHKKSFYE